MAVSAPSNDGCSGPGKKRKRPSSSSASSNNGLSALLGELLAGKGNIGNSGAYSAATPLGFRMDLFNHLRDFCTSASSAAEHLSFANQPPSPQLMSSGHVAFTLEHPVEFPNDTRVFVFGISHSSVQSADQLKFLISEIQPDVVCLESDPARSDFRVLKNKEVLLKYNCDFDVITDVQECGGDAASRPSISEVVGLMFPSSGKSAESEDDGCKSSDFSEFFLATGGAWCAAENTALYEHCKRNFDLVDVDILQHNKLVQNHSASNLAVCTKRIGNLNEQILKRVVDDKASLDIECVLIA